MDAIVLKTICKNCKTHGSMTRKEFDKMFPDVYIFSIVADLEKKTARKISRILFRLKGCPKCSEVSLEEAMKEAPASLESSRELKAG